VNISRLMTCVAGVVGPLYGVAIAWTDEMTLPLSGFVVLGVATEPLHPASVSVMATVATTTILRTVHSYSTAVHHRGRELVAPLASGAQAVATPVRIP